MNEIKARYRIIVQEGDTNFTADEYANYRWLNKEKFNSISYYIYGDTAALINFKADTVRVYAIHSKDIAEFYKREFDSVWSETTDPIK